MHANLMDIERVFPHDIINNNTHCVGMCRWVQPKFGKCFLVLLLCFSSLFFNMFQNHTALMLDY